MPFKIITPIIVCAIASACGMSNDVTELRGKVDTRMVEQVQSGLAQGHRAFTINSSNGGYVFSADMIAAQMKNAGATLTVNGRCWSACSLIVVAMGARQDVGADVQSHASAVESTGRQTNDAADRMAAAGYSRDLASGPNLRRIDGTMAAPADAWANRDPFH